MESKVLVLAALVLCVVRSQPVEKIEGIDQPTNLRQHSLWKRFINPSLTYGDFSDDSLDKTRTKRSLAEDCERLQLCRLHARSRHSFFAAFELYFVNKENAKLWDHQTRSRADCDRRFSCYR